MSFHRRIAAPSPVPAPGAWATLVLAIVVLLPACHSFQPFERGGAPAPGTDVRIEIGPAGDADLFEAGRANGSNVGRQRFRGEFIQWTPDTLTIRAVHPGPITARYDTLRIPGRFVRQAETMRLDGRRTALTLLSAAAVTGVVVATQFNASGGAPPSGGSGGEEGGIRTILIRFFPPR